MTRSKEKRTALLWKRVRTSAVIGLGAGTMFASSCSSNTVRAIIDGIDAATSSLDRSISDQDQTFGEWLLSELVD